MKFKYEALDREKRLCSGVIEASQEEEALELLHQKDLLPISLRPLSRWRLSLRRTQNTEELALFTSQFLRLLEAGLPVDKALEILRRIFVNTGKTNIAHILENITRDLAAGSDLAEAFSKYDFFPPYYVNLIRAGQAAGALVQTLKELNVYLENYLRFRQELISALLYPSFLLIFGIFAIQTVLVYVLPRFGQIFDDLGVEPPLLTKILLKVGFFWKAYGPFFLLGMVILFFYLKRMFSRPEGRKKLEEFMLSLPVLNRYLFLVDFARAFRGLAVMLKGGVPIEQALSITKEIASLYFCRELFSQATEKIRRGQPLSFIFRNLPRGIAFIYDLIAVGEETGNLARSFSDIASLAEEEIQRITKRFLTILEPVTILFFGLILGTMIVSILLAIFSLQV